MKRTLLLLLSLISVPFSAQAQRQRPSAQPLPPGAPRISAEFPAADIVYGPTNAANGKPVVASGPDQSLVVWSGQSFTEAARVDSSGRTLDATPIVLPGQPAYGPDVVWDDSHYLVVTASWSEAGWIVRLVGVSTDGRIDSRADVATVADQVVDLSIARHASGELAIAYATRNADGSQTVSLLIVGVDGRTVQRQLMLGTVVAGGGNLKVASSPTGYLAIWDGGAAVVRLHGATSNVLPLPLHETPDVVWNGTDFAVVTADSNAVRMFHVFATGEITAATVIHPSPYGAFLPALAWNGTEYRVLWKEATGKPTPPPFANSDVSYDLRAARVTANGAVIDDRLLSASTDETNKWSGSLEGPAVAPQGDGWLLVWTNLRPELAASSLGDVYALKITADEEPSPDDVVGRRELVSRKALFQTGVALSVTPGSARAIWSEITGLSWLDAPLRTASVDRSGHRSETSTVPGGNLVFAAPHGDGTVVISREMSAPYRLMAQFVDHNGIAATPFPLASPPSDTSVSPMALACGANDCAVAYSTIVGSATDTTKYHFQRFTPAGALIDAQPIDIPVGLLGLSARGDEYLLAFWWPTKELVVSRFAGGKLSDVTRLASDLSNPFRGAVASNTTGWLVAWMDYTATGLRQIRTFRVEGDGSLQGETDLVFPSGTVIDNPSATWDGRDWLVAWSQTGLLSDVYAARIAPDGTLLDSRNGSPGFGVAATVNGEYTPVIGSAGDGLTAVAYVRATTEQRYGETSRVFVRWIDNR